MLPVVSFSPSSIQDVLKPGCVSEGLRSTYLAQPEAAVVDTALQEKRQSCGVGRVTLGKTTCRCTYSPSLGMERTVVWGIPQCGSVDSRVERNLRVWIWKAALMTEGLQVLREKEQQS